MTEEADYPPSFCVWDLDQQANPPPPREESGAMGEEELVRKDNEWKEEGVKGDDGEIKDSP